METAKDISRQEGLPILCTGDLIDFVSDANLKAAAIFMNETHALFVKTPLTENRVLQK